VSFNIIIPMAGKSSRFDYNFKPFLNLDNRVFIEHVLDSFSNVEVDSYNFIVRRDQESSNQVSKTLKERLFPHLSKKINVVLIDKQTEGPFQTIQLGLKKLGALSKIIVCDCDHYVDIRPMIEKVGDNPCVDIVIPTWDIHPNEHKNWGKIIVNPSSESIVNFSEKQPFVNTSEAVARGIIGCYYFKSSEQIQNSPCDLLHFSQFFSKNHKDLNVELAKIKTAYFFGDPKMAKKAIEERRKKATIICDVDGVLLRHKGCSNDIVEDNFVINDAAKKIQEWRSKDKLVVLSTARPRRTRKTFEAMLQKLGIEYDRLVMGLNPGPRYLINDLKPSNPLVRQSLSINLTRDAGIDDIDLNESGNYDLEVIETFKGNSFSKTVLVSNNGKYFVRKYIVKNQATYEHYEKLKRQLSDLQRLKYYDDTLVPKILNSEDNDHWFYFDMEYLENYKQLDEFGDLERNRVLEKVVTKLHNNVYCYRKKNTSLEFMETFYNTKIEPKLVLYENECEVMKHLINQDTVVVNGKQYSGLRKVIEDLNIYNFNTEYLSPIHGDLTLENILYNETFQDFKLIDLDGSRFVDTCYFDLGKIFQSIVSNYREWNIIDNPLLNKDINNLTCTPEYFNCNIKDYENICQQYAIIMDVEDWLEVYKKGIFYMSMYFIRFIPFRRQINEGHGIYAMIMAINWLNHIHRLND